MDWNQAIGSGRIGMIGVILWTVLSAIGVWWPLIVLIIAAWFGLSIYGQIVAAKEKERDDKDNH